MSRKSGFTLIELLIVVAIILTIAAIAIPNFLKSRIAANESAAVNHIRTLSTAEVAYAQTYPALGYTCNISDLGPPTGGGTLSSSGAGIVDVVLASGTKQGYAFTLTNCIGTPHATYKSAAVPVSSASGERSFCSDATGVIMFAHDGTIGTCQSSGQIIQ